MPDIIVALILVSYCSYMEHQDILIRRLCYICRVNNWGALRCLIPTTSRNISQCGQQTLKIIGWQMNSKVGGQSQISPLSVIVRLSIAEPGTPCEMRREYKYQSNSWWFDMTDHCSKWSSRHSMKVTCNPAHTMSGPEIWSQENMTHLNKWW